MLHSRGRIYDFVPYFIDAGVDVLNMQQPQLYGIEDLGRRFGGEICFPATADIQRMLPSGSPEIVGAEVRELVENWSTPKGGLIVQSYVDPESLELKPEMNRWMLQAFAGLMNHYN